MWRTALFYIWKLWTLECFFFIYLPLFYVSSVILWRILCFFPEILWRILCFSVDPMKNFMFFWRSYKEFIFFRRSYENFYVLSEILWWILCFDIFFKKWICLFDVWVSQYRCFLYRYCFYWYITLTTRWWSVSFSDCTWLNCCRYD